MTAPASHRAAMLPVPQVKHEVRVRATPSPKSGELLIKITATAINPADWKIRDFNPTALISEYPAILGSDAAGEVAAVGANVTDFKEGDRVFFQGILGNNDNTTFQQYCKIDSNLVGKTPKNISDDEAAGISLASMAVVTGLYDHTGEGLLPPWSPNGKKAGHGKAAIIIGGSSSVGQYALQYARLSGFERVITNSSSAHAKFLESLGASTVLDRSKTTAKDFRAAAGDLEVDFVFDAISEKDTQILGIEILRGFAGGKVITVQEVNKEAVKIGQQEGQKSVSIKQVMGFGSASSLRYLSEPMMKALGGEDGYLAAGEFFPNRPEVIVGGLDRIEEAFEMQKKGVSGKKVVIRPS